MAKIRNKDQRDHRLVYQKADSEEFLNFNLMKVGNKTLKNDVLANLDFWNLTNGRRSKLVSKEDVEKAIQANDYKKMKEISVYFYNSNGIYRRLCEYMAFLYRYDWVVTPIILNNKKKINQEQMKQQWYDACLFLDNSNLKQKFGEIALKVIKEGCYYGYIIKQNNAMYLQELPNNYSRSRYQLNGKPAIEMNVKYFDEAFSDVNYRVRVLKMFPKEIQKGYLDYKNGVLPKDFQGDDTGWVLLDPKNTIKFSLNNNDAPLFVSMIPSLIDLLEARDLDKKKMLQQILKIIIQKLPLDKNGDLIFAPEEAQTLHANAVNMLSDAIGVDILTTFADVDVADMSDRSNVSSVDWLEKVERSAFNDAGVSQMQFNTSGNLALEKSIANDEASVRDLLLQFQSFLKDSIQSFCAKKNSNIVLEVEMLPTTIYNYKDMSKLYKEQTMLGFSKMLPQVALGHSQLSIMSTAFFENEVLKLDELFVAPQMSSTMSGNQQAPTTKEAGRPELPDDEKSTKTIQNKESQ